MPSRLNISFCWILNGDELFGDGLTSTENRPLFVNVLSLLPRIGIALPFFRLLFDGETLLVLFDSLSTNFLSTCCDPSKMLDDAFKFHK